MPFASSLLSSHIAGWNTKLDARASNYGSRIDYILVTPGLLPWIADSDIQPDVFGSDHCPVWVDLHESIVNEQGETLVLKDLMNLPPNPENPDEPPDPPRFATRFWDEFSGKQRSLKDFFGGGPNKAGRQTQKGKDRTAERPLVSTETVEEQDAGEGEPQGPVTETKQIITEPETETIIDLTNSTENSPVKPRRKTSTTSASTAKKKVKQPPRGDPNPSQTNLATFFRPPQRTSNKIAKASQPSVTSTRPRSPAATTSRSPLPTTPEQDSDYLYAKALASAEEYTEQDGEDGDVSLDQSQAVASWSSIFAKKVAPRCRIHNLPCKAFGKLDDLRRLVGLGLNIPGWLSNKDSREEQGEKVLALFQVSPFSRGVNRILIVPSGRWEKGGIMDVQSDLERRSIRNIDAICTLLCRCADLVQIAHP